MVDRAAHYLGKILARFLTKPLSRYQVFSVRGSDALQKVLQPADVLLVEGDLRISMAIKYLTQSTWSHSSLYVGDALRENLGHDEPMLVEADISKGVIAVPLSKYKNHNTRICRAIKLADSDRQKVVSYVVERLGNQYDLKNVLDLVRYLIRTPPVPMKWRRRMLALGSGDPTKAICSSLIAQAFQSIPYPILPEVKEVNVMLGNQGYFQKELMRIRHHSLFVPRDFDLSPYFEIVKPTLMVEFDYKKILWGEG